MNDTIGIYYELPDGSIAYTYGWCNTGVSYRLDDNKGGRVVDKDTFQTWKPRADLKDFPNASDPRLPYVFDLLWDIKYTSDLICILKYGHEDITEIKEKIVEHGIKL